MTQKELMRKYQSNTRITGFGLSTTVHTACPFCGAGDFLSYRIIDVKAAVSTPTVCKECERGSMMSIRQDDGTGQVAGVELFQTSGPDLPEYLSWVRRVQ